ncbi:MAG: PAS domain S-box protein [Acidimicrobiales bacterium]
MALRQTERDLASAPYAVNGVHPDRYETNDDLLAQLTFERARLSATLDSLMDPHVIFAAVRDDAGKIVDFVFTDANDAAIAYNHSTREGMIGAHLSDILPGHRSSGVFDSYVKALESGEPLILDDSIYFNEAWNSLRHCDVRALKVGDSLSYTWRDVTERVETLERYKLLAENASDIVYEGDAEGTIRWISPSCRMLGWNEDDLLGHSVLDFVYEEDHDVVLANRKRVLAGDKTLAIEARYRSKEGGYTWMSVSAKPVFADDDSIVAVVVGLSSIEAEMATRKSLAESEAHYRLLAENASDVVYETDRDGVIMWVSPSVFDVLGWRPDALIGTRAADLVAFEDSVALTRKYENLLSGSRVGRGQIRLTTASGHLRWMSVRAQPTRDASRQVVGSVISLRDCESEVAAQRAARTLSAGSEVLVRSEREGELLAAMCQTAVDEGGYALAWYARRIDDLAHTVAKVVSSEKHRDYVEAIKVNWSSDRFGCGPTGTAIRTGLPFVSNDLSTSDPFSPWLGVATSRGFQSCIALPVSVEGVIDGSLQVYSMDLNAFDDHVVDVLKNLTDELGFGIKRLRDHERLVKSLKDQALLTKAIDQASESILITDPAGDILYANPSALRTSGYDLEELMGVNPRILRSELHDQTFFQVMWQQLLGGQPWHGTMINRRKIGELFEEDVTISPIHDPDGGLLAYVAVKRDLTLERRQESNRSREQRDRLDVLEVMQEVRRGTSLPETAEAFCRAAVSLVGIDAVITVLVQADGTLLTIGTGGEELGGATSGVPLAFSNPEALIERTEAGPWWIDLSQYEAASGSVTERMIRGGFRAIGNVPIRWEGQLVGILALATRSDDGPESMGARLPAFEELGSYAGALFGAEADVFFQNESLRTNVQTIIEERRFHPVFQPFVELDSGLVVGYEALTRFEDGESPEKHFARAHSIGMGSELEALCAQSALEAARDLAPNMWLSLNFSPAALIDGHAAKVVKGVNRPLVIEVTEHAQVKNYAAIRRALREIGTCRLAVDDAGAGYTSLSHILELQPDFVKLDISLVRDIDTNPARQAMIAGMCHFAAQSGTILIAEGIETDAEARMLRELGVPLGETGMLGQGYLFGKPRMLT